MRNRNSLSKNYIFNLLNKVISLIIPLITVPYLTRVLGAKELGIYNYTNTIASYYLVVAMMGMTILGTKEISLSRDLKTTDRVLSKLLLIQIFNTIICILGYIVYIIFFCKDNKIIALIQLIYILSAIFDITWFLQGLEKFKLIALRNIFVNIITTVLIFTLVKDNSDIIIYTFIKCSSILISQIILIMSCLKNIHLIKPSIKEILFTYRKLFILFVPGISESIFHNMDRVMLGMFINYSSVAIYYTSRMITDIPQCLITSINTVIYPRITALINMKNDIEVKKLTYFSFEIINALCIAMAFGIAVIARDFVQLYLGEEYQYCATTIKWLAPYIVLAAWNGTIRYQFLLPNSMEKIYSKAVVIGIFFNLVFNVILIRELGVVGAIIATLISEFITAIIQTKEAIKEMEILKHLRNMIFYFFSGVFMYIIIYKVNIVLECNLFFKLIIEILIGILVYSILTLIAIMIVDKSIRKEGYKIIKKYKNILIKY